LTCVPAFAIALRKTQGSRRKLPTFVDLELCGLWPRSSNRALWARLFTCYCCDTI